MPDCTILGIGIAMEVKCGSVTMPGEGIMKQLKAEGAIVSPVRCKWAPAE